MRPIWKLLIAAAVVIGVVAFLLAIPHFSAKAALEKYRAQLQRQGEKMSIAELTPSVSAEEVKNGRELLAAASTVVYFTNSPPIMRWLAPGHAMVGWAETILPTEDTSNCWPMMSEDVKKHREAGEALRAALQNPGLGFPINYAGGPSIPLMHLTTLKKTSLWLSGSAVLAMHERDTNSAWENLKAEAKLVQMNRSEPLWVSQLVRMAMVQIAIRTLWEGLQYPGWSEDQLAELQTNWNSFDLLDHMESSLDMERVSAEPVFSDMRLLFSNYNNLATFALLTSATPGYNTWSDVLAHPLDGIAAHLRYHAWKSRVSYEEELVNMQIWEAASKTARNFRAKDAFVPELSNFCQSLTNLANAHPNWQKRFVILETLPFSGEGESGLGAAARTFLIKAAEAELGRRMAVTALALKRYQLRHGNFPTQLEELVPDYLPKVPNDLMDGKLLRYRRKDDGMFLLYSVGMDGKDDGGDGSPASTNVINSSAWWYAKRDVVWPVPAKREEVAQYKTELSEKLARKQNTKQPPK